MRFVRVGVDAFAVTERKAGNAFGIAGPRVAGGGPVWRSDAGNIAATAVIDIRLRIDAGIVALQVRARAGEAAVAT